MTSGTKSILVSGDVVMDHHLYEGSRLTPEASVSPGTCQRQALGGASLVAGLLSSLRECPGWIDQGRQPFEVLSGTKLSPDSHLPEHLHTYSVWRPYPASAKRKQSVWRAERWLGYGRSGDVPFSYADMRSDEASMQSDVMVLDDAGLGFRSAPARKAWPDGLDGDDADLPQWIVLRMSGPVCQGDLWRHVSAKVRGKLVVLVSIDDIRHEEAGVSKGLSWERSAADLVLELAENPTLRNLLKCRHLVVSFRSEGALLVQDADARLVFDRRCLEGDWEAEMPGSTFNHMSCLMAAVASELVSNAESPDMERAVRSGLTGMRALHTAGHGSGDDPSPGFPFKGVAEAIASGDDDFAVTEIPSARQPSEESLATWSIMEESCAGQKGAHRPLYGLGRRVALMGPKALRNAPYVRFGKLFTVDRSEIECLRNIRNMMLEYEAGGPADQPLSIAVFGPPGAGKSFGIKQIAKGVLGDKVPIVEFNLSQLSGVDELIGAFHQVRDKVLEGITPLVFWDEFDSGEYKWLQYLLAPMQDGSFQEGQITHPIGKCIFVFAGATSYDMSNFGPRERDEDAFQKFKLLKGPDFISRLSGYLNVLGPNGRQYYDAGKRAWIDDKSDVCFPVRRALLLRVVLGLFGDERLDMDRGVLSSFLEIGRYRHGARSLKKVADQLKRGHGGSIRRSDVPPRDALSMQVDYEKFMQIVQRDAAFKTDAEKLAPAIHEFYRNLGREEGWITPEMDVNFDELSPDVQDDNQAAAIRIPQVLELVGLYVVPAEAPGSGTDEEIRAVFEDHIELLAEAEHDGWMEHKLRNGWRLDPRNDDERTHPALMPYRDLSEKDRGKDHNSVRAYPDIVTGAAYKIVTSLG